MRTNGQPSGQLFPKSGWSLSILNRTKRRPIMNKHKVKHHLIMRPLMNKHKVKHHQDSETQNRHQRTTALEQSIMNYRRKIKASVFQVDFNDLCNDVWLKKTTTKTQVNKTFYAKNRFSNVDHKTD